MSRKKSCIIRNKRGRCLDDNIINSWILLLGVIITSVSSGIVIAFVYKFIPLTWWSLMIAITIMYVGILVGRVGLRN